MVDVETTLSWVLRTGVLMAAVLMLLGFFLTPNLLWAGVIVLAITPLVRVAMSGLLFLFKGERFFFVIALYVILILVISIFII
jgi:uncharacterized membrane protein